MGEQGKSIGHWLTRTGTCA